MLEKVHLKEKHLQYLWRRVKWKRLVKKHSPTDKKLLDLCFLQVVIPKAAPSAGSFLFWIHSRVCFSNCCWSRHKTLTKWHFSRSSLNFLHLDPFLNPDLAFSSVQFSSVHLLSRVRLFATPWIAALQASLVHHQLPEFSLSPIYFYTRLLRLNFRAISPDNKPFWKLLLNGK